MATDANLQLQASTTQTASHSGAAVNLPGGTPRRGLKARVLYSAASNASGANAVEFGIDVSPDGVTWYDGEAQAGDAVVNLGVAAQAGEIFIPFETSQPYVRLTASVSGAGTVPTITYEGDIVLGRP